MAHRIPAPPAPTCWPHRADPRQPAYPVAPSRAITRLPACLRFFIVPLVRWSRGLLLAVGATVAFVVVGAAIGFGTQWAIEASVRRRESA